MRATSNQLQQRLFDLIGQRHPLGKKWLNDYMEWANVKKSTAYNHRNGITALTADETIQLMQHYAVSWRDLFTEVPQRNLSVHFPAIARTPAGPLEYIEELQHHFRGVHQAGVSRLYFFSNDLPLFYYFRYPLLTAFKFYYWDYAVWGNNQPGALAFDPRWIEQPAIQKAMSIARDMYSSYMDLPRTEFWSPGMLNIIEDTIRKTEKNGGILDEAIRVGLRQELSQLKESLFRLAMAEDKSKFPLHEIRLNPSVYANNSVLVITEKGNHVFTVFENPNIMYSSSEEFGAYTEAWFMNILGQSQTLRGDKDAIQHTLSNGSRGG